MGSRKYLLETLACGISYIRSLFPEQGSIETENYCILNFSITSRLIRCTTSIRAKYSEIITPRLFSDYWKKDIVDKIAAILEQPDPVRKKKKIKKISLSGKNSGKLHFPPNHLIEKFGVPFLQCAMLP